MSSPTVKLFRNIRFIDTLRNQNTLPILFEFSKLKNLFTKKKAEICSAEKRYQRGSNTWSASKTQNGRHS